MKCSKCNGEMEEGLLGSTFGPPLNGVYVNKYGTSIKKSFLGQDLENKKEVKIYRCKECGYLESYAK